MNDTQKIQIAKDFMRKHRFAASDWFLMAHSYLDVYNKLVDGVYGNVDDNAEYTDDGVLINAATEFRVEIKGHETVTGNPYVFEWTIE